MQLDWARNTGERTLILAPLGVAHQTVREGERWGIPVAYARSQADAVGEITITNYEMVDHFDADAFGAVVLDESSILKSFAGKVRTKLIERFSRTPLRLCCTATPAPNDISEIANHAEFLGLMTRADMLATFFVHDDDGWRLKRHARDPFYRWLASWGMAISTPSDLGYSDDGYILPHLTVETVITHTDYRPEGQLFALGLKGIGERSTVRKGTLEGRVQAALALIRALPEERWIVWCGLNDEGRAMRTALGNDAVLVEGADSAESKAAALTAFAQGEGPRCLLSKTRIAGFGLNLQICSTMIFLGLSDSWEQYFQAIRRCWRFGQTRPVTAYIVLSSAETPIIENVLRKERDAMAMQRDLIAHVAEYERVEIGGTAGRVWYEPREPMELPSWLLSQV